MNKNQLIDWMGLNHYANSAAIVRALNEGREVWKYDAAKNTIFALLSESDLEKIGLRNDWFRAGGRVSYGTNNLPAVANDADCIGIELETEGERVGSLVVVSNIFDAKRDGSLDNGGAEFAFRAVPVTVSGVYHFISVILPRVASLFAASGLTSWKGGHCGLHLHRSIAGHPDDWRRVFESNYREISQNETELSRVFRQRHYDGPWCEIAGKLNRALQSSGDFALALAMCDGAPNTLPVQEIRAKIRKEMEKKTMAAVGLRCGIGVGHSGHTVEYRIGRGSLRPERLQMEVAGMFRMSEGLPAIPPAEEGGRLAVLVRRCHAAIFGGEEG